MAYDVRDYSFSGPDWLKGVHFDIVAKPPQGTSKDEISRMAQKLLEDRFKLAVHRETRIVSAYALVVAKTGLKIKEVEPGAAHASFGRGAFEGTKVSLLSIADWLGRTLNQPVMDKTNAKSVYDIKVEFLPDEDQFTRSGVASDPPPRADPAFRPSIFTALQEQLGLNLQPEKLPLEVLVVDHIERMPTEN